MTEAERACPPASKGWYVVVVLVVAYTLSYIDRTLLTLLVQPIRQSLHITDVQISLLQGFAFAIFYSFLGVPIGRLLDRASRKQVIVAGVAMWSVMTALCGAAGSFMHLFAARIGVGVGEAALSPGAYSMLSDLFPAKTLPRALSVYSAAIYAGSGLALIGGGVLIAAVPVLHVPGFGDVQPWQSLFVIAGAPGLLVALWIASLREPVRRGLSEALGVSSLRDGADYIWRRRGAYLLFVGGFAVESLLWNGTQAWLPSLFMRMHHWSPRQTGLVIGTGLLVCGTSGIVLGGIVASYLRRRNELCGGLRVGIASALFMLPTGLLAALAASPWLAATASWGFILAGSLPYGAAAASLQDITPNQLRGQVSALYLLGLNLAGIGLGPVIVAFVGENVFGGDQGLRASLAVTTLVASPLAACLLAAAQAPYRRAAMAADF